MGWSGEDRCPHRDVPATLGEEVAVLVSEKVPAGTHQTEWNASNQPSGVYFYRLQAEDFVQTRKLVLLR